MMQPSPMKRSVFEPRKALVNSPSANVYGAEIGWQQMLIYGFGYQLNGTLVHTNRPERKNMNVMR